MEKLLLIAIMLFILVPLCTSNNKELDYMIHELE